MIQCILYIFQFISSHLISSHPILCYIPDVVGYAKERKEAGGSRRGKKRRKWAEEKGEKRERKERQEEGT